MIQGNFSACPQDLSPAVLAGIPAAISSQIHNNIIPASLFDPASLKLAALLPPTTGGCGQTGFGLVTDVNENQYVGRGDYQTSTKNTLFGRYIRTHFFRPPSYNFTPNNLLTSAQGALDDADQSWVVGETYLFSPTLVNQFRASVDRIAVHRYADNYVSACDLGVPVYCGYVPHQSGFTVTGAFTVGPGTGGQAKAHSTPLQTQRRHQLGSRQSSDQLRRRRRSVQDALLWERLLSNQLDVQQHSNFPARRVQHEFNVIAERSAAGKVVHEFLCAGYLEGDLSLDRQRGPALGALLPAFRNQRLGL